MFCPRFAPRGGRAAAPTTSLCLAGGLAAGMRSSRWQQHKYFKATLAAQLALRTTEPPPGCRAAPFSCCPGSGCTPNTEREVFWGVGGKQLLHLMCPHQAVCAAELSLLPLRPAPGRSHYSARWHRARPGWRQQRRGQRGRDGHAAARTQPRTAQEDAASCPFCSPSPRAAPSTPQQPVCLPTLGPKLKPSSPNPHLWVLRCPGCLTREAGGRVDPFEQLPGAELAAVVGVAGQHQLAHLHLRGAAAPHGPRRLLALPRLPAARGGALRRGEMLARGCGALARPR